MSILTPSRGHLLSLHNPTFGSLQPSAMPAPPPSISPRVNNNQFLPPPKLQNPRLEEMSRSNVSHCEPTKPSKANGESLTKQPNSRNPLASLNANTPNISAPSRSTTVNSKIPRLPTSHPIPLPSAVPDVFAPQTNDSSQAAKLKRSRESLLLATPTTSKRSKTREEKSSAETSVKLLHQAEEVKWTQKWLKAFPTLTFYFEIGADDGPGKTLRHRVLRMGAKVDQFFSHHVTHLVVRGGASPTKPRPMAAPRRLDPIRESPKNPFLDGTGVTDLVQKAEAMQIKVWTVKKLADMLSRLAPVETSTNNSLSHLLEDERLHGTRERDLSAPRPDYYYFKPGAKYLLVEDATGRNRTIMVKEYAYNAKEGSDWPVLFSGFLRPPPSAQTTLSTDKIRERAWSLYVERQSYKGEEPPSDHIKRSTSLRSLPEAARLPNLQPYENASGNSVVLTSNIASTSAANNTPGALPNGLPSLGVSKDRALMQMSKRVQVLKGNARLAAKKQNDLESAIPLSRRASTGAVLPGISGGLVPKTFLTQDQVVGLLKMAKEPVYEPHVTIEERIKNREKVDMGLKGRDQDTASGYCENCRLRYQNLSVHIASKKHRRFATNDENFEDLDNLLCMLRRPSRDLNGEIAYPPCHTRHSRWDDCELCGPSNSPSKHDEDQYCIEEQEDGELEQEQGKEIEMDEDDEGEDENLEFDPQHWSNNQTGLGQCFEDVDNEIFVNQGGDGWGLEEEADGDDQDDDSVNPEEE